MREEIPKTRSKTETIEKCVRKKLGGLRQDCPGLRTTTIIKKLWWFERKYLNKKFPFPTDGHKVKLKLVVRDP